MKVNTDVIKQFLNVEKLDVEKTYNQTPDGVLTVEFKYNSPLTFSEVLSVMELLNAINKFTKYGQVDTILKTSVEVSTYNVTFKAWVDDVNLDNFYNNNKNGHFYQEMLKHIKGLVL